ncbi:MAG TPA: hypothetical protein VF556_09965 [Pyrinomonadaceae bacterium]|jgi:hypothetical protein
MTLAEKIEASKVRCQTAKDYISEKKRAMFDELFEDDCDVFVIKRDEKSGELVGRLDCNTLSSV